ncbi:MAG: ATP synthase F1 subunit delta [Chloroflexota bacterium]|nr:ATP synthase F1 subunit delta [Lentimicrobium sp.]
MNNSRINLRYATALYEFAVERNQVEETYNDIQLVASLCSNRDLRLFLQSPVIFPDKKIKVLDNLLKGNIGDVTHTFISILVKKRREENLPGIANSFIDIYREAKNIKVAQVTSASVLDESLRNQLTDLLKSQTQSEIILEEVVDPGIIGGLIVKIEGEKFDDSIKRKIVALKQEFNVNTYIKGY